VSGSRWCCAGWRLIAARCRPAACAHTPAAGRGVGGRAVRAGLRRPSGRCAELIARGRATVLSGWRTGSGSHARWIGDHGAAQRIDVAVGSAEPCRPLTGLSRRCARPRHRGGGRGGGRCDGPSGRRLRSAYRGRSDTQHRALQLRRYALVTRLRSAGRGSSGAWARNALRSVHHQHGPLELGSSRALQIEAALLTSL